MRILARGRWSRLETQAFPRHGSTGKSAHANRDIDAHYDVIKVYVPGEFRKIQICGTRWDDCIRPNADLEMKPQIRSKEQLKCMYSECLDGTGKFKDLNITLKQSQAS